MGLPLMHDMKKKSDATKNEKGFTKTTIKIERAFQEEEERCTKQETWMTQELLEIH